MYSPQKLVDLLNQAIVRIQDSYDAKISTEARIVVWLDDLNALNKDYAEPLLAALVSLKCAKVLTASEEKAMKDFQLGSVFCFVFCCCTYPISTLRFSSQSLVPPVAWASALSLPSLTRTSSLL
jgi:hypothetical protein